MHSMFSDILPRQLFAPPPEPAFGGTFTDEHFTAFEELLDRHHLRDRRGDPRTGRPGCGGCASTHLTTSLRSDNAATRRRCCSSPDEIATGFGRSGELFGCDHAMSRPDIMCVGKALTGATCRWRRRCARRPSPPG
ncbi:MAG: aminotransferase class III-fold pyridoxal phosphate-dependent enzyme [Acidimicrobiales bacterium]